jgi:methylated-DNA-[protein]-cysteine S-methyltransferase
VAVDPPLDWALSCRGSMHFHDRIQTSIRADEQAAAGVERNRQSIADRLLRATFFACCCHLCFVWSLALDFQNHSHLENTLHPMSKRTRTAAEFLGKVATTISSNNAATVAAKKQRVDVRTSVATVMSSDNYSPANIASLRQLVATGGPLKPSASLTEFQRRVYALTRRIPAGKVSTYAAVAASLNAPKAYRAVGNALRHNPFAPHVPCHRVLASDGRIGGFAGSTGECALVDRKLTMLQNEGLEFDQINRMLKKDPTYRRRVIIEKIDATGIDQEMTDAHLTKQ